MSDQNISQFGPAMEELGINPDSLDASDLDFGSEEVEETPIEEPKTDEEVEESDEDSEESESVEETSPEGEEKEASEESASSEEVSEEKTAEEVQAVDEERLAFEAERKAFTEERAKIESEFVAQYAEKLKAHDEFDSFLGNLASKDPELFSLLQEEFADHRKANSNPIIEGLKRQQDEMSKALSEIKEKFSDEATRTKYYAELDKVKSTVGKEAEALGIKTDWKMVEEVWKNNPKLSLTEAFHAKYGASYAKAAASKAKVQAVENKVKARPAVSTAGTIKRPNSKPSSHIPTDTESAVRYFARQLTGKN